MQRQNKSNSRVGEKLGWIGGGLGAILWIGVIAIVLLAESNYDGGVTGIVLVAMGMFAVFYITPWRYPEVKYRMLLIPIYSILLLSIVWAFVFLFDSQNSQSNPWIIFVLLPMVLGLLSPVITIGKRKWSDGNRG
ncbi:hypothetical protein BAC3_01584 [uncultured bacterium]|nr:hypothetical protein BAC3_01584 [uncultured bacterium]